MDSTKYYDTNTQEFFDNTFDVDMTLIYSRFERYLNKEAKILDAGCGSGRDTKYFLSKGYDVAAIDASKEMVKCASDFTGIQVQQLLFQDIPYQNEFDGIWSCASLLHVPKQEIYSVFDKFIKALKIGGIWYMSFKYGEGERTKDNRLFNDYTNESLSEILNQYKQLQIIELWLTDDRRSDRDDKWINALVKKIQ